MIKIDVIIETKKGSTRKYELKGKKLILDTVLPKNMKFPFYYGYKENFSLNYSIIVKSLKDNKIVDQESNFHGPFFLYDLPEGEYRIIVTNKDDTYLNTTFHSYGDKKSRTQMFGFISDEDIEYPTYVKLTASINPDNCASVYQEILTGEQSPTSILNLRESLIALSITFIYLIVLGLLVFSRIELL